MCKKPNLVETMIHIYCDGNCQREPGLKSLCSNCEKLLDYAVNRLEKCPKGDKKTSCGRCDTPCYCEPYKSQIRLVMKYAGPRMAVRHPIKTIKYVIDHL